MIALNPRVFSCLLLIILSLTCTLNAQTRDFAVQVAAFRTEAEAQQLVSELRAKGLDAFWIKADIPGKGIYFRVRYGRFGSNGEAAREAQAARSRGQINDFMVAQNDKLTRPSMAAIAAVKAPAPKVAEAVEKTEAASAIKPVKEIPPKPVVTKAPPSLTTASASVQTPPQVVPPVKSFRVLPQITFSKIQISRSFTLPAIPSLLTANGDADVIPPAPLTPLPTVRKRTVTWTTEPPASLLAAVTAADYVKAETEAAAPVPPPATVNGVTELAISNSNWEVVRYSSQKEQNLQAIWFTDEKNGWAAGDAGVLYQTTDSGRRWDKLARLEGLSITQLYFADASNGWLIGAETESGQLALYRTNDSGKHWRPQSIAGIMRLQFTDANNGWAVGRNASLLRTTDGGASWQRYIEIDSLLGTPVEGMTHNYGFTDVHFTDAKHGWVIGNFYGRVRTNIGGLFKTEDGGVSWSRIPLPIQSPKATSATMVTIPKNSSSSTAAKGTSFVTGRIIPGMLRTVRFSDEMHGTVTGEIHDGAKRLIFALQTSDGGKNWQQFDAPGDATTSAWFLSSKQGWTATSTQTAENTFDITLLRTEDGGITWRRDLLMRGNRIRGIFFLSPTTGWAVGDRGMILRYEDRNK